MQVCDFVFYKSIDCDKMEMEKLPFPPRWYEEHFSTLLVPYLG